MAKLEDGGIFYLIIGKKYKYETKRAAMFIIFLLTNKWSWKNIPKLIKPSKSIGKNKLNNGTSGLLNTG